MTLPDGNSDMEFHFLMNPVAGFTRSSGQRPVWMGGGLNCLLDSTHQSHVVCLPDGFEGYFSGPGIKTRLELRQPLGGGVKTYGGNGLNVGQRRIGQGVGGSARNSARHVSHAIEDRVMDHKCGICVRRRP